MIDEPKRENTVLLTIMKPDETKQILKVFHTKTDIIKQSYFWIVIIQMEHIRLMQHMVMKNHRFFPNSIKVIFKINFN